jgi:undecaprenyl diphosphate synthase
LADSKQMEQSTSAHGSGEGLHVAIIMDGNGRWAVARGHRREWGHQRGAEAVRRVVSAAPGLGIRTLTLYAFSSDNWGRPAAEVRLLMRLFHRYLRKETDELARKGVRLTVVGRRDRLEPALVRRIEEAETATASGRRMFLRLAVDYSSRDVLLRAASRASMLPQVQLSDMSRLLGDAMHSGGPAPDVDLLIRTGGERRLSDFLLWECAYAELYFTPVMWPEFQGEHLADAIAEFRSRDRRFGKVAVAS